MKMEDFTPTSQRNPNFKDIPYTATGYPNATVRTSGCGPCSALMMLENLTSKRFRMKDWIAWVQGTGARIPGGTDMKKLAKAMAAEFGLSMETTNDEEKLRQHLEAGGLAIANNCSAYGSWHGLFSTGGHFVAVVGMEGDSYIISDPDYYKIKYTALVLDGFRIGEWRRARVKIRTVNGNAFLLVSANNLHRATVNAAPNYYLFKKEGGKVLAEDEVLITINGIEQELRGTLMGSTTMAPARTMVEQIAAACGKTASVAWDNSTRTMKVEIK